jgi:hypothetical protein
MLPTAMGAIGLIEIDRHDGSTDVELMGESEHRICAGCIKAKLNVRLLKRAKEEKRLKNGKRESRKNVWNISSALQKLAVTRKKTNASFFFFQVFLFPPFFLPFFFFLGMYYILLEIHSDITLKAIAHF